METRTMKVNPLPVRTWHFVGMNDSGLTMALPQSPLQIKINGAAEGLTWNASAQKEQQVPETGMGEAFSDMMQETDAAELVIPDGVKKEEPVVISVSSAEGKGAGRIRIHAGKDSEASVVLAIVDDPEDKYENDTVALQLEVSAEADAHLSLFVTQMLSETGICCVNIGGACEDGAKVELSSLSFGAEKSYIGVAMQLRGNESTFAGELGTRVRHHQTVDVNYVTRHEGRKSVSDYNASCVLEEGAKKLFRGTIDFKEGCAGSVGGEKEDVLLLGENQTNQTIPLILCHEEDVEGNHGATISRLNERILFYLETRGIGQKMAENMVAEAKLEALVKKIPDQGTAAEAEKRIGEKEKESDE